MFVNMGNAETAITGPPVEELLPERPSLDALREAAAGCRACELWRLGTQTVFGEGAADAELALVGEQPGDREDANDNVSCSISMLTLVELASITVATASRRIGASPC